MRRDRIINLKIDQVIDDRGSDLSSRSSDKITQREEEKLNEEVLQR